MILQLVFTQHCLRHTHIDTYSYNSLICRIILQPIFQIDSNFNSCFYKEYSLHACENLSLGYTLLIILLDYRPCIPWLLDTVKLFSKVIVPISLPLAVFDISHCSLDDGCEIVYYFKIEFTWLQEKLSIFLHIYWQIWLLWTPFLDCLPIFLFAFLLCKSIKFYQLCCKSIFPF